VRAFIEFSIAELLPSRTLARPVTTSATTLLMAATDKSGLPLPPRVTGTSRTGPMGQAWRCR
jgi:hypothetical protein